MININLALFSLVVFAIAIGWLLGRYTQRDLKRSKPDLLSRHYFSGLNYLLNEQPDKAVDLFVHMLEVDSETVEMHLALGSLFRRRGEVDRAIRIHQNLIARPQLSKKIRVEALLELGRDYMHAGVYDRAERLFLEALEVDQAAAKPALKHLLTIYQHEKDWNKALEYAERLKAHTDEPTQELIANYYCELFQMQGNKISQEQCQFYVEKALEADPQCVRISLLEGQYYQQKNDFKSAIRAYKRVKAQNLIYVVETIRPIVTCYEQLGDETGLVDYLYQCLNDCPSLTVILMITAKLQQWQNNKVACDFIIQQVRKHPSMPAIYQLIHYLREAAEASNTPELELLENLLRQSLRDKPGYQCQHCGFSSKTLDWLCPGCKRWNVMQPITS